MITVIVALAIVLTVVFVIAPLLISTANRLHRLHVRIDSARAGLLTALSRRAAVARSIASSGEHTWLAELVDATERAEPHHRVDRENALTDMLHTVTELAPELEWELLDASHRVEYAQNVYNESVRVALALRRTAVVRIFRLAGTAASPVTAALAAAVSVRRDQRRRVRTVLLDEHGRVLLGRHDGNADVGSCSWVVPGGDVEPGEPLVRAAVRELWKETGVYADQDELIGPMWVRRTEGIEPSETSLSDAEEWFYLLRTGSTGDGVVQHVLDDDLACVSNLRWWWTAELRASVDPIWPTELADLLAEVDDVTGPPRDIH